MPDLRPGVLIIPLGKIQDWIQLSVYNKKITLEVNVGQITFKYDMMTYMVYVSHKRAQNGFTQATRKVVVEKRN